MFQKNHMVLKILLFVFFSFFLTGTNFFHISYHSSGLTKNVKSLVEQKKSNEKQIGTDEMNYQKWVKILGKVTRLINTVLLQDKTVVELNWSNKESTYLFSHQDSAALHVNVLLKENNTFLLKYTIIPWQNFSINQESKTLIADKLLTVTEYAVIFFSNSMLNLNPTESEYSEIFDTAFKKVINYEQNQAVVEDNDINIPSGVQVISANVFKHYIDLQVAIPGSHLPEHSKWEIFSKNKMLHLSLVPDMGPVKSSWIKTAGSEMSVYYTSFEKELQELFSNAVDKSLNNPANRKQIFTETKESMRGIFNAANSYVDYLYNEYEAKLERWLLLFDQDAEQPVFDDIFPDYQPKRTPDTALDFMLELEAEINKLPAANTDNLIQLLNLLDYYQDRAKKNPGHWEDGNMILGAKPKEYIPSADEILVSETGNSIQSIINSAPKEQIQNLLRKEKKKIKNLEYTRFTFTHVDVMGSGRFFYVETIEKVNIILEHP